MGRTSFSPADRANAQVTQPNDAGTTDSVIQSILGIHDRLCNETDLSPGPVVNELLTKLVSICIQVHDFNLTQKILDNAELQKVLPSLRAICSQAECCLESHWAAKVVAGTDAEETHRLLKSFPYYSNYEKLARLELCAICSVGPMPRKVAFIGSGPMPLTSLCLLEAMTTGFEGFQPPQVNANDAASQIEVLNIDINDKAIAVSKKMGEKLGKYGAGAEFVCAAAGSKGTDLTRFDVVYLAALVGGTQAEKEDLIINVLATMQPGALLVIRSSWGLRTVLYSEFDVASEALLKYLEVCLVVHPYGEIVNSVVVAKVKQRPELA